MEFTGCRKTRKDTFLDLLTFINTFQFFICYDISTNLDVFDMFFIDFIFLNFKALLKSANLFRFQFIKMVRLKATDFP